VEEQLILEKWQLQLRLQLLLEHQLHVLLLQSQYWQGLLHQETQLEVQWLQKV
jgi:hypothetical protein